MFFQTVLSAKTDDTETISLLKRVEQLEKKELIYETKLEYQLDHIKKAHLITDILDFLVKELADKSEKQQELIQSNTVRIEKLEFMLNEILQSILNCCH